MSTRSRSVLVGGNGRQGLVARRVTVVAAAHALDHVPAGAQHEAVDARGIGDPRAPRRLQHHQQHGLHQIAGAVFVPQVAQAVKPDARREAAAQLGLGGARGVAAVRDRPHQLGVGASIGAGA